MIGTQLRDNVRSLTGSGVGLAVGVVVTLYGCLGAAAATQNAFNRVWAVPRNRRPNPLTSRLRSLVLLPVLAVGVLVTTVLAGLTTSADAYGANVGMTVRVVAIVLAVATNIGLFVLAFRVLTATRSRRTRYGSRP